MKIAYVLDGAYHFRVGGAVFSGGAGTMVVVPRGSYHTFVTATGGKLLFVSARRQRGTVPRDRPPWTGCVAGAAAEVDKRFATAALPDDKGRPWRQLQHLAVVG
jgi:glyoxylate utilization-related uncharacterized protein